MVRCGLYRQVRENSLLFIIARIETLHGVLIHHLLHPTLVVVLPSLLLNLQIYLPKASHQCT